MMEFRVHRKLRNRIENERRDIALMTLPGMGLSTLLKSLEEVNKLPVAWLDTGTITHYWLQEYKNRPKNRRYVLHAATIKALIRAGRASATIEDSDLYRTSLPDFLGDKSHCFDVESVTYVVIDNFDELASDLALIVCNELKALDDWRGQDQYRPLKSLRFLIGGAIDFAAIYGESQSGVSPATNFAKCRPYEFLLSSEETQQLLEMTFPELTRLPPTIMQLVVDWSGGYVHYAREFARWIVQETQDFADHSYQAIITYLKQVIEEQDKIPLFSYCESAWNQIQNDQCLVNLVTTAISAGSVSDTSVRGRTLERLGILMQRPARPNTFFPVNRLIELYLRQRLAEIGKALPASESALWSILTVNAHAHKLIHEIENRLRNFIGDQFYARHKSEWSALGIGGTKSAEGHDILEELKENLGQEQKSIFFTSGVQDPILTYLDIADLGLLVQRHATLFNKSNNDFVSKLPEFIEELNFYRRRVAHNRPITAEQIDTLESRWQIIQRMMAKL